MSLRLGYKQTAEHIRNSKLAKKKSAWRRSTTNWRKKKRSPAYQIVVDPYLLASSDPATETLNTLSAQPKMDFDAARAYLTRFDTTPDAQLTPEERFIKRMGERP